MPQKANSVELSSLVQLVFQEEGVVCHWISVKCYIDVSDLIPVNNDWTTDTAP